MHLLNMNLLQTYLANMRESTIFLVYHKIALTYPSKAINRKQIQDEYSSLFPAFSLNIEKYIQRYLGNLVSRRLIRKIQGTNEYENLYQNAILDRNELMAPSDIKQMTGVIDSIFELIDPLNSCELREDFIKQILLPANWLFIFYRSSYSTNNGVRLNWEIKMFDFPEKDLFKNKLKKIDSLLLPSYYLLNLWKYGFIEVSSKKYRLSIRGITFLKLLNVYFNMISVLSEFSLRQINQSNDL